MADVQNVKLGVCDVTYNSVALGHTKGGVEVTYTPEIYEKTVDKFGSTPVGAVLIGERLEVKVPMAEHTLANLKVAMPGGTLVEGATLDEINFGADAGGDLTGAVLLLHPTAYASATTYDWTIHKAICVGAVAVPYKVEEETIFEATFLALIDESKSTGEKLFRIGISN